MKISYKHLIKYIKAPPEINELSEKLFQLGHEHDIYDDLIDFDLTPNRGDCLSLNGILRDLKVFYDINLPSEIFTEVIEDLEIDFENKSKVNCPKISFMKIEIDNEISGYKGELKSFFNNLNNNKNNFFTDISNYISYETGQPTHCYDFKKLNGKMCFENITYEKIFETLLDTKIKLVDENYVFTLNDEIINLAGVIGGKSTSCSESTRTVLIECAYFKPEIIIGKSIKYDIKSEASHKFERGVDYEGHEIILRRFASIVKQHAKIKNIQFVSYNYDKYHKKDINLDLKKINKILGTNLDNQKIINYLGKINISIDNNIANIPSYRNDIETLNDLAEELARIIGYNNISPKEIIIPKITRTLPQDNEQILRAYLINNGFFEVINQPFTKISEKDSIKIDNPLDSNKCFMRKDLQNSLIDNLLYNERRQKDSVKLFEISDVYFQKNGIEKKKRLALIASGRIANNYKFFQKQINNNYFEDTFQNIIPDLDKIIELIPRMKLDTKLSSKIIYAELDLDKVEVSHLKIQGASEINHRFSKINKVSDLPSSFRDISFSIKEYKKMKELENSMLEFKHSLIKEVFVFDYYKNDTNKEIKIGFRFIFQDKDQTITDSNIDEVYNSIIKKAFSIKSVSIPGYNH